MIFPSTYHYNTNTTPKCRVKHAFESRLLTKKAISILFSAPLPVPAPYHYHAWWRDGKYLRPTLQWYHERRRKAETAYPRVLRVKFSVLTHFLIPVTIHQCCCPGYESLQGVVGVLGRRKTSAAIAQTSLGGLEGLVDLVAETLGLETVTLLGKGLADSVPLALAVGN